ARYHGVAMEGYYWRFTDAARGRVVVALIGVNRDGRGGTWATVALAAHPGGHVRSAVVPEAWADPRALGAGARDGDRTVFAADARGVRVDLGDDARLDARIGAPRPWPRRALGGIGPAQVVPALSQYWHPHLTGGAASGSLRLGDLRWELDGAQAYGEKNWGDGHGFPPAWWWGQAQGFAREDACVAFAGGRAGIAGAHVVATSLVVVLGDELIHAVRPLVPMRVHVDGHGFAFRARTPRHSIELEAHADATDAHLLPVPVPAERRNLDGAAVQHLAGALRARVARRGRTVWEGESALAGLERGTGPALERALAGAAAGPGAPPGSRPGASPGAAAPPHAERR
ncbi:MAG TPA: tocopherol cyclase family protein, partial [Solirubrobacteraceae bacterium]|nr:tocopherol cyclase family protein [Solirubrobacteraceae bacterium]